MGRIKRKLLAPGAADIAWIERHCVIPQGPMVGEPVRLCKFQRDIVMGIYGSPTRRAIISLARKNAKTSLAAFILLLHLAGPRARRNSQLYSDAQSREQAGLLFAIAAQVIRLSPTLYAVVTIRDSTKQLFCPEIGTLYRALSADASTAYGLSPVLTIHDELGQVRGPHSELYSALETGSAAQDEPLSIVISTQARSDSDLLSTLIDDAAAGNDPRTKLFMWSAPEELDAFSEDAIRAANPAFDEFQNQDEVRQMAADAKRMPASEGQYRNLVLNQRVDAVTQFIAPSVWKENGAAPSPLDGATVAGGLDLAAVHDLTAATFVATDGSVHVFAWLPQEGLAEKSRLDKVDYVEWKRRGFLLTTPGRAVDYDFVARQLRDIFNRCNVTALAFDRAFMRFLRPCLVRAGFTEAELAKFVEHGQGFLGMAPAIRELEVRLLEKRLKHGNHPVLTMCAANAAVVTDDAGNRKFTKRKSTGRIDALVSLAMACGVLSPEPTQEVEHKLFFLG